MSATKQEVVEMSRLRPDKFTLHDLLCGECGNPSTLVYSEGVGWLVEHENLEDDSNHEFFPTL